jgi:hypothetical protein
MLSQPEVGVATQKITEKVRGLEEISPTAKVGQAKRVK